MRWRPVAYHRSLERKLVGGVAGTTTTDEGGATR
jgi:hypothetical protein